MTLGWRFAPEDDPRFYAYVIKHNGTPIWVGLGCGSRWEVKSHCVETATPVAKRDYILRHLSEITSEIVLADLTWAEAGQHDPAPTRAYLLMAPRTIREALRLYAAAFPHSDARQPARAEGGQ
jgi:hypothetical protein